MLKYHGNCAWHTFLEGCIMATKYENLRLATILTALRGVLMLIAGLFAIFMPADALLLAVVYGGALLLIDGVLGLWAVTFGGQRNDNVWFDVIRNALAIFAGILILASPFLATIVSMTFVAAVVGAQAIVVGAMSAYIVTKERAQYTKIWPVLFNSLLYIAFGAILIFRPFPSMITVTVIVGAIAVVFAIGLFMLAYRMGKKNIA